MVSTHLKNIKSKWESSPNRGENKKKIKPPPNFSSHGSFRVMRWNKPSCWEMLGALGAPKTLSTCAARLCCFGVLFVYLLVRSTMLDMFCLLKDVKIGVYHVYPLWSWVCFSDVLRMVKVTQSLVNLFNLMKDIVFFGRILRIRDRDEIRFLLRGFLTESWKPTCVVHS